MRHLADYTLRRQEILAGEKTKVMSECMLLLENAILCQIPIRASLDFHQIIFGCRMPLHLACSARSSISLNTFFWTLNGVSLNISTDVYSTRPHISREQRGVLHQLAKPGIPPLSPLMLEAPSSLKTTDLPMTETPTGS